MRFDEAFISYTKVLLKSIRFFTNFGPMNERNIIRFFFDCKPFWFPKRTETKEFIASLIRKEKYKLGKIHYTFCSDETLRKMNKRFLNHPDYTDILTFPLSDKEEPVCGEIYISIERIRDNSLIYNNSFREECLRVLFHGALHLCNYNDHSEKEIREMREKENFYLDLFRKNVGFY